MSLPSGFGSVLRTKNRYDRQDPLLFSEVGTQSCELDTDRSECGYERDCGHEFMYLCRLEILAGPQSELLLLSLRFWAHLSALLLGLLPSANFTHFFVGSSVARADLARKQEKAINTQKFGGRFCGDPAGAQNLP